MGFKQYVSVREDVLDPNYDEKLAPELYEVIKGTAPLIYSDPAKFFERTYLTTTLRTILLEIGRVLTGGGGHKIFPILAFFGGGKTHTLLTIYHAITNRRYTRLLSNEIYESYKKITGVEVIVIYGKDHTFSPSPLKPLKQGSHTIKTLWGYIADKLGKYDLMARDDEQEICPDSGTIKELLSNKRVVILVDEILDYIDTLYSKNKGYVKEVVKFFDRLAEAIESTNNVLVITIAAEKRGAGEIEPQRRYRDIRHVIKDLMDGLLRIAGNIYAPVTTHNELYMVLKKRLFKEIKQDEAEKELKELFNIYREYSNVFGDTRNLEAQIKDTYPFHPSYLNILREIAERVTGNRTRFVMRVSRLLIRKLLNSSDDPVLIMPWHIDPHSLGIEGLFFMGTYSDYQNIYLNEVEMIDQHMKPENKPELIKAVLRTIFLSTYPYDSLTLKPVFPTSKEIARMVYEPDFFRRKRLTPVDIQDALSIIRVTGYVRFLHYDESSDKYWYSRIASIKEWIEREAERLLEEDRTSVENKLLRNVQDLMVKRLVEYVDKRTGKTTISRQPFSRAEIFDSEHMYAYKTVAEADIPDNDYYKLVTILYNQPEKIRELIYKYQGNERTYANTVVAITVSTIDKVEALLNFQAHLDAVNIVMRRIDELYGSYTKEIRDIEKAMAYSQMRNYENLLLSSILNFYDLVYYPTTENSEKTIGKAFATSSDKSITDRVISTLASPGIGKILRSLNFEALKAYLAKIGIEIKPGISIAVGDIINAFKTRPELPMVKEDRVVDALREGIANLEIALVDEFNRRYFKRIYSDKDITSFSGQDRGDIPSSIRESYRIIHWRDALQAMLEEINKDIEENNNRRVDGGIQKIEYYVYYDGNRYPLKEIEKHPDWENILRYGFIVKKTQVIRQGVNLTASTTFLEITPGDKPRIELVVEPLGGYEGSVEINVPDEVIYDHGPLEGRVPLRTWIVIDGSRISEHRSIVITAIDDNGNMYEQTIFVRLKKREIEIEKPEEIKDNDMLIAIEGDINNRNVYDVIGFISRLHEMINIGEEKNMIIKDFTITIEGKETGRSKLDFSHADPSIVSYVVNELLDVMGSDVRVSGRISIDFREKIKLTATLKRLLVDALKNTGIRVKVERVED